MDVLAHVSISRLQREVLGNQSPHAHSRLEAVVSLLVHAEGGVMQTSVQLEEIADVPVVFQIQVRLQCPDTGVVRGAVEDVAVLVVFFLLEMDGRNGRAIGVMRQVRAKLHVMVLERLVVEISPDTAIIDS